MHEIIINQMFTLWRENGRQTQTKRAYPKGWMPKQPQMKSLFMIDHFIFTRAHYI